MRQEQMIQTFHHIFLICSVLAVLSGSMTVIFFRKFQIRKFLAVRMGREAKKEIKKIEEANHRKGARKEYRTNDREQYEEDNVTERLQERKEWIENPLNCAGEETSEYFIVKKNVMMIHTDEVIGRDGGTY